MKKLIISILMLFLYISQTYSYSDDVYSGSVFKLYRFEYGISAKIPKYWKVESDESNIQARINSEIILEPNHGPDYFKKTLISAYDAKMGVRVRISVERPGESDDVIPVFESASSKELDEFVDSYIQISKKAAVKSGLENMKIKSMQRPYIYNIKGKKSLVFDYIRGNKDKNAPDSRVRIHKFQVGDKDITVTLTMRIDKAPITRATLDYVLNSIEF